MSATTKPPGALRFVVDLSDLAGYRAVIARQYDGVFAGWTGAHADALHRGLSEYVARVLAALELPDDGAHLDVGSGSGLAALAVARARPEMRVVGIDASEEAVALARRAAAGAGLANARFDVADAESPPAGKYRRISAISVFNLLPDKAAALRAWRRVGARDARLVLTDAFAQDPAQASAGAGAVTDAALVRLARDAGWRIVRREDLTRLVRELHAKKAWPWPEYVRDGFRYQLVACVTHP